MPSGLGMTLIQRFTVKTTTTILLSKRSGDNANVSALVCNQPITYIINVSSSISIPDGYVYLIDVNTNSVIGGSSFTGGSNSINVEITLLNGLDVIYNTYALKAKYDGYIRPPPLISLAPSESPVFYQDVLPDGAIPGYLQIDSITTTATAVESFLNDFDITATLAHGAIGFPVVLPITDIVSTTINVVGATNTSPIEITTGSNHGLVTGSNVRISGVGGNTAANTPPNESRTITVTAPNKFTINGSVGNGTYTGGGTVTTEAKVTTSSTHHLLVDQVTRITGSGVSAYNGFFKVGPSFFTPNTFSLSNVFNTVSAQANPIAISSVVIFTNHISITTYAPHKLQSGDYVRLENIYTRKIVYPYFVIIYSSINGIWQVNVIDDYKFSIPKPPAYSDGVFEAGYGEKIFPSLSGPVPNTNINDGYIDFYGIENNTNNTKFLIAANVPVFNNVATVSADGFDGYSMVWPAPSGTYGIEAIYKPSSSCFAQFNSPDTFSSALKKVTLNGIISEMTLTASPYIITNASNESPIMITTSSQHALNNNDYVSISGVVGNTAANGTFKITTLSSNISATTATSPIQVTTSSNHNFVTGQLVTIVGVDDNPAANGIWTITVNGATTFTLDNSSSSSHSNAGGIAYSSNTFKLNGTTGNGSYIGGGIVKIIDGRDISDAYTVTPIEITTSLPHLLSTGDSITITGTSAPGTNGIWSVTVIDSTKFSLNGSTGEATPHHYNDGIVNIANNDLLRADFPNGPPGTPGYVTFEKIDPSPSIGNLGTSTITNRFAYLRVTPSMWGETGTFKVRATYTSSSNTVTGATNASPIVITTGSAHGLSSGQIVTISGVTGNTAANNTWVITVVNSNQFSLNGSTGNGNYVSGGTIKVAVAALPQTIDVTV
jgi:hypothetical protein